MLSHLAALLFFKTSFGSESKSGIITFKNSDEIIYAKSYEQSKDKISYISCSDSKGSIEKKDVSVFEKEDICLQVSSSLQMGVIKSLWSSFPNSKDKLIVEVASQRLKSELQQKISSDEVLASKVQVQVGQRFNILLRSSVPGTPDRNLLENAAEKAKKGQ